MTTVGQGFQKWRPFHKRFSSHRSGKGVSFLRHRFPSAIGIKSSSQFSPYMSFGFNSQLDGPGSRLLYSPSFQISDRQRNPHCFRCGKGGHLASICKLPVRCYFCGDLGHKKNSCSSYWKMKPVQSLVKPNSDGFDEDPSAFVYSWVEPNKPMDVVLLEPDVAACLENLEPSQPPVFVDQQFSAEDSDLDLVEALAKGNLKSQSLTSFSQNLGTSLGLKKGFEIPLSSRFTRRSKLRCWFGKENRHAAFYRQRSSALLWDIIGKGNMDSVSINLAFSSGTPVSSSNEGNGEKVRSHMDIIDDFDDLSPVTLEEFSPEPAPVLDDSNLREDEEGPAINPAPRSSKKTDFLDEVPSFEGKEKSARPCGSLVLSPLKPVHKKKKKVSSSMKIQVSSSPFNVRRSPRFSNI